jgi:hypothetical protein
MRKDRERDVAARLARQRVRKLRADEAVAELERAQRVALQSRKQTIAAPSAIIRPKIRLLPRDFLAMLRPPVQRHTPER